MCTIPGMMLFKPPICEYCGKLADFEKWADGEKIGIYVCDAHRALGERDIRACWYGRGFTLIEDIIEIYPQLGMLTNIAWRGLDGTLNHGGSIAKSTEAAGAFAINTTGVISLPIVIDGVAPVKQIFIDDIVNSAEFSQDLLDKLKATIAGEMYMADYNAYKAAADEQWAVAQTSTDPDTMERVATVKRQMALLL